MKELYAEIRNSNLCMVQILKDKKLNEIQKLASILKEVKRQSVALKQLAEKHKL